MTLPSIALFTHLLGMLLLFSAFAIEWMTVELLRRPETSEPRFAVSVLRTIPRFTGIAVALILASGGWLGAQYGVLRFPWVGVSLAAIVLMAALGGIALRPVLRGVKERDGSGVEAATAWRHDASRRFLHASLRMRVGVALAIVYLMVAKPGLFESVLIVGLALVAGLGASVWAGRSSTKSVSAGPG
jgi:hypothetical protein